MATPGGVRRWTHAFVVASAISMLALQLVFAVEASYWTVAVVGLFGAVLPMVFGMAYLLLPSYVGETLRTPRLPGVHFALTYLAVGLLVGDAVGAIEGALAAAGPVLWSAGVAIFVGSLLRTVVPAVAADPGVLRLSAGGPRRSTRLTTLAIPVAIGYLLVGTGGLLALRVRWIPQPGAVTGPAVLHLLAAGFVALLVFALGIRLLTGFFHVDPPRSLSWLVLGCGSIAPGLLTVTFWRPPWFLVGAALEVVAVVGYAGIVSVVALRAEHRRVGLYGIALGALAGALGVTAVASSVFEHAGGIPVDRAIALHVPVMLDGFLLLTIVGYAVLFFPVTGGQFLGASRRSVIAVILLVAAGTLGQAAGAGADVDWLVPTGAGVAFVGLAGYTYLLSRRLRG